MMEQNVIDEAKTLFPDSISDVEAVGEYAVKVYNELKLLQSGTKEFKLKSSFYLYLNNLRTYLHETNIDKMSRFIKRN